MARWGALMIRMIDSFGVQPHPSSRRVHADRPDADVNFDPRSRTDADRENDEVGMLQTAQADEQAARLLAEADSRRYRFLAKAIPQIVWTATPDGRLDSYNPRWAEYTGLESHRDHEHDRDWHATLHPDDVRRWFEGWTRARTSGTSLTIDLRLRRTDGSYRWHLARALPVLDRPGHAIKKMAGNLHRYRRPEAGRRDARLPGRGEHGSGFIARL